MSDDLLRRARSAVTPTDLCAYVADRSHPSIATAWTCGLAATALLWMLRLHRHDGRLFAVPHTEQGGGHLWVQDDRNWYDPTIGQFSADLPISGPLPHPLFAGAEAPEPSHQGA